MSGEVEFFLSPSSINDFLQCPAKFWYSRKYKPLPVKTEAMKSGLLLHKIIATYYKLLPNNLTPSECFIYIRKAIEEVLGTQSLNTIMKKFGWHLSKFEKFEKERLSWHVDVRPIAVEREFIRPPFKGIVDAIFKKNNKTIVVDWKSGRAPNTLPDYYTIQGCIYASLTNADEVIFYFLTSGRFIRVTYGDCTRAKDIISKVIQDIKNGVFEWRPGSHCDICPYQIPCYIERYKLDSLGVTSK